MKKRLSKTWMKRPANLILRVAALAFLLIFSAAEVRADKPATISKEEPKETVILIHGMGRTRASLLMLGGRLRAAGYETKNFPYGEMNATLAENSARLLEFIENEVETDRYHIVAHSLGCILVRDAFRTGYPTGLGRIVMLAPPNHPSHLARVLGDNLIYRWRTGDSGQRLSDESFYKNLPVPDVEFGVIAGRRGNALAFDEPNDGIVAVAATRLDGMVDFIVVNRTHTFTMNARETARYCMEFLQTGRFVASESPEANSEKQNTAR